MQAGSISRRYAKAIFELAREAGAIEQIGSDLNAFGGQLHASEELTQLFSSPAYPADIQVDILRQLLAGQVHQLTLNFLMLLADRHRMSLFGDVVREFERLRDEEEGIVQVRITSAASLPAEIEDRLVERLTAMVGKKIALTKEVDPALIGGLVTQVGHMVFDGSLSTQFSKIRRHLEHGEAH